MTTYQCFFFSDGFIKYWENVELDSEVQVPAALRSRLLNNKWKSAEAWFGETLVCRVETNEQMYSVARLTPSLSSYFQ